MNPFHSFQPISLSDLNSTSELLNRYEQKYLVPKTLLQGIIENFSDFNILEHVGKRIFCYDSTYFDDNYATYWQHHQGRRKRFKVRSRYYVDSNICYLEMKVKSYRYSTDKQRMKYPIIERLRISREANEFIKKTYRESYGQEFEFKLSPVIKIVNRRITLVHKNGGERVTIDFGLKAIGRNTLWEMPSALTIIETKTKNGRGVCDRILRGNHVRPVNYCSKYCLGLAQLGLVPRYNTFKPVLRQINQFSSDQCSAVSASSFVL